MATRLFQYGDTYTAIQQGKWLPGVFATTHSVNLNKAGFKAKSLEIEYGEIVGLTQNGIGANAGYNIARVASGSTLFGVIVRTTDGQISMEDDWIVRPRSKTAVSVYPLANVNNFMIAVPVRSGQTPTVGNDVFVSYANDWQGSVQTSAGSTDGIKLTGWVFASEKYKPTKGSGEAVIIQRVL